MTTQTNNESKSVKKLIDSGMDIAGNALAGAAVGFFTGGPAGAVIGGVGGAAGPAATQILKQAGEFTQRILGHREEVRVGATLIFAVEKIQENIAKGHQIRQDGFFQDQPSERSAAEEIVEGVLLAAQREREEKKLQFYGNLIANIAFRSDIDRAYANLLITQGEDISYRQMCLLAIFSRPDNSSLRQENYQNARNISGTEKALLQEIYNLLYSQRLLDLSDTDDLPMWSSFRLESLNPGKINVQEIGIMLYNLMEIWELWKINSQDLETIVALLSDSKLPPSSPQIQVPSLPQTPIIH